MCTNKMNNWSPLTGGTSEALERVEQIRNSLKVISIGLGAEDIYSEDARVLQSELDALIERYDQLGTYLLDHSSRYEDALKEMRDTVKDCVTPKNYSEFINVFTELLRGNL